MTWMHAGGAIQKSGWKVFFKFLQFYKSRYDAS